MKITHSDCSLVMSSSREDSTAQKSKSRTRKAIRDGDDFVGSRDNAKLLVRRYLIKRSAEFSGLIEVL